MDKTTQNLIWSCLPHEYKKEVKRQHRIATNGNQYFTQCTLEYLFGYHNLTSDAEGEEMLTVSRKKVQEIYRDADNLRKDPAIPHHAIYWNAEVELLQDLFGFKCLPDETKDDAKDAPNVDSPESNVDTLATNVDSLDPKPAEAKFKVGDKVKHIAHPHDDGIYRVDDIKKSSGGFIYHIQGLIGVSNVKESDLEPYTEPVENVNLSQETANCDKQFDNILKDCFSKERRLNVAVQMIKAMMGCPEIIERISSAATDSLLDDILHDALYLTDRLMSECEEGGFK